MNPSFDLLLEEARNLMYQLEPDPAHAVQVHQLSLQLAKELHPHCSLSWNELHYLQAAALLHDIGWSRATDGKKHHKFSAQLIRDHRWNSIIGREIELIAQIARYHRKRVPGTYHQAFDALSQSDRTTVSKCASLLRIADAIDRSHTQHVSQIKIKFIKRKNMFQLILFSSLPIDTEIYGINKKKDLFESFFRTTLYPKKCSPPSILAS